MFYSGSSKQTCFTVKALFLVTMEKKISSLQANLDTVSPTESAQGAMKIPKQPTMAIGLKVKLVVLLWQSTKKKANHTSLTSSTKSNKDLGFTTITPKLNSIVDYLEME